MLCLCCYNPCKGQLCESIFSLERNKLPKMPIALALGCLVRRPRLEELREVRSPSLAEQNPTSGILALVGAAQGLADGSSEVHE